MFTVKLSTPCTNWPFSRQTPGGAGIWENYVFVENQDIETCDFWVVYDDLLKEETTRCPKTNTIIITGEPPSVKRYSKAFLDQFSTVVTCQDGVRHTHVLRSHPAQPWHVGRRVRDGNVDDFTKNYDELTSVPAPEKQKLISVISSNKTITRGHRKRLKFVSALKEHFGDRIDVYGRGIADVEDKWDAIAPYRYHVVLENSCCSDYWTEKLADSYLAGAFPFYYGCPNLKDYFPEHSYLPIDVDDITAAITAIETALSVGLFEKYHRQLEQAKHDVLTKHNLYSLITTICNSMPEAAVRTETNAFSIKPECQVRTGLDKVLSAFIGLKERFNGGILPRN